MRVTIEIRLYDDLGHSVESEPMVVAELSRRDANLSELGLSLAEGRQLLANVQSGLIRHQVSA